MTQVLQSWLDKLSILSDSKGITIATGATAGVLVVCYLWRRYFYKLPPGPIGLPIIGAHHLVTEDNFDFDLGELGKKYGDIYSIRLGTRLLVVLLSHSAIREAFIKNAEMFAYRTEDLDYYLQLNDEFLAPYNAQWNTNKTITMACARAAGFGATKEAEAKILDQANYLTTYMETLDGKLVKVKELLPQATSNVISQIVFNKSYEYQDPEVTKLVRVCQTWSGKFGEATWLTTFPRFISNIFYRKKAKSVVESTDELKDIIRKEIKEHMETLDPDHPRDFIDLYWLKKGKDIGIEQMVNNTFLLIPDAVDTTSIALDWIVLYLSTHPEIQQRMVSEINQVTAGNRQVKWSDRSQLPCTEAVIREVLRLIQPLSLSLSHTVPKDIMFRGYKIPAGTDVYAHLLVAMKDPKIFPDPDEFRPERFLNEQGHIMKSDNWMPFSLGRRMCAGHQLAEIMWFIFIANMFQRFEFQIPADQKVSLKPSGGLFHKTEDYYVKLTSRM